MTLERSRRTLESFNTMDKMENKGDGMAHGKTCNCPHHKVLPILTIITGVDFLLGALRIFSWWFVDVTWPILLIIGGVVWMKQTSCGCCSK